MKRVVLIVGVLLLILSPFVLLVLRNPAVSTQISRVLPKPDSNTERYSITNETSDYTIRVVDTAYFDYLTEDMDIFKENGVIDPRVHKGFPNIVTRYNISHIRFVFAPTLERYLLGVSGKNDFAGRGDYELDGDTLIIKVSVDPDEVEENLLIGQFLLEDMFVRTAAQTLYYAHGLSDLRANAEAFLNIKNDITEYLYTGVFAWPISITRK